MHRTPFFRHLPAVALPLLAACSAADPTVTAPDARASSTTISAPNAPASAAASASVGAEKADGATPAGAPSGAASATPASPPAAARWVELEDAPGAPELDAGARAVKDKDWKKAATALSPALDTLRPAGRVDVVMAGGALLGRALERGGDHAHATTAYRSVVDAWKGDATVVTLTGDAPDDATRTDRVHRALLAVGEALFFFAEEKRVAADKLTFPTLQGPNDAAGIRAFVEKKVTPWMQTKRAAIQDADDAYTRIAHLEPAAPPHWLVDAAARVGQMKGAFAASFRAAPLPREWMQEGRVPAAPDMTWADIRAAYYSALDSASAPILADARAAYEACATTSKRFDWVDDFSKSCNAWLEKNP